MVVNEDRSSHTLTSEKDDFDEVLVQGGADGTFTAPTEPGEYAYVCTYHPEMTGTLVVK
jgi:plastocyanin